jgi:hypothetical protein
MLYYICCLLFFILIPCVLTREVSETVSLKGGLIFRKEGSAQINQDFVQYTRTLDTKALQDIAQRLKDSTTLYKTYCSIASDFTQINNKYDKIHTITDDNTTIQYIHTPLKYHVNEAEGVCTRLKARRVEIKNLHSYNAVRTYATKNHITMIMAGIDYKKANNIFVFASDGSNARTNSPFPTVEYGGSYHGAKHVADWDRDSFLIDLAQNYPLIYKYPVGNFVLRLADTSDKLFKDFIMCEKDRDTLRSDTNNENNMLVQLAIHNCKRDMPSIVASTDTTLQEIQSVTTLTLNMSNNTPDWHIFFPQFNTSHINRQKRSAPYFRNVNGDIYQYTYEGKPIHIKHYMNGTHTSDLFSDSDYWDSGFSFDYERYRIIAPKVATSIPDYVIMLHAFWQVQQQHVFHKLTFEEWMFQQGNRFPLYLQFKKLPYLQRIERDLAKIEKEIQQIWRIPSTNYTMIQTITDRISRLENKHTIQELTNVLTKNSLDYDDEYDDEQVSDRHNHTATAPIKIRPASYRSNNSYYDDSEYLYSDEDIETTTPHTFSNRPTNTSTHAHRHVRSPIAPLIAFGIAAGSAAGGAMVGAGVTALTSPTSSTSTPDKATLELYKKHARTLEDLKINQETLGIVVNNVITKIALFETQIIGRTDGTAAVTMEIDLKTLIRQLQTVIQLTLLKYNSAFLAASFGRTSPYVLPQHELDTITHTLLRTKGFIVSHDLNLVKTYTLLTKNEQGIQHIDFIFEMPVIDPNKEFSIYTVFTLPNFHDNTTYLTYLDSNHIAINQHGDKYTTLTDIQINRCLDTPPVCKSNTPITPIADESSCVALTYVKNQNMCSSVPQQTSPKASFLFFDSYMFYSVPSPTSIYAKCFKSPLSNAFRDVTLNLQGIGQTLLQPTCTLNMPDGTTHSTPNKPTNITDIDTPLFSELRNIPQPVDFVIQVPTALDAQLLQQVSLRKIEPPNFMDLVKENFHPVHTLSFAAHFFIGVGILLVILSVIGCCCPKAFKKCCKKRQYRLTPTRDHDHESYIRTEPLGDTISEIAAQITPPSPYSGFSKRFHDLQVGLGFRNPHAIHPDDVEFQPSFTSSHIHPHDTHTKSILKNAPSQHSLRSCGPNRQIE